MMVEAFNANITSFTMKDLFWLEDFTSLTVFYFWFIVFIWVVDSRISQSSHEETDGRQTNEENIDDSPKRSIMKHRLKVIEGISNNC
jgi:hypothetical protein